MNRTEENIKQLEYILDVSEWDSFLLKNYQQAEFSFRSFRLGRDQRFKELLVDMIPNLRREPDYYADLKGQTSVFFRKLHLYEWPSLANFTELLRLGAYVFDIDRNTDNVGHLLNTLKYSLPKVMPPFVVGKTKSEKRYINEYKYFLSTIVGWVHLYAKSERGKYLDLDWLHKALVTRENSIFHPYTLSDYKELSRVNFYYYAWMLIHKPEAWMFYLHDQLDVYDQFINEHNLVEGALTEEQERIRKRKGILSMKKIFSLINDFRLDGIISEQDYKSGLNDYYLLGKHNFERKYVSLLGDELLRKNNVRLLSLTENEELRLKPLVENEELSLGAWITDDAKMVNMKNSKQIEALVQDYVRDQQNRPSNL